MNQEEQEVNECEEKRKMSETKWKSKGFSIGNKVLWSDEKEME
jgi:hypothetical protein